MDKNIKYVCFDEFSLEVVQIETAITFSGFLEIKGIQYLKRKYLHHVKIQKLHLLQWKVYKREKSVFLMQGSSELGKYFCCSEIQNTK